MGLVDRILEALGLRKRQTPKQMSIRDAESLHREQLLRKELQESLRREEALRRRLEDIERHRIQENTERKIEEKERVIRELERQIEALRKELEAIKRAPIGIGTGPIHTEPIMEIKPEAIGVRLEAKDIKNLPFGPYTFDNFIVSNNNKFVYMAAKSVAEMPADAYNPLFIFGGVGLGKTHLLKAIANYIVKKNPNVRVVYTTSEEFSNDLLNAIETANLDGFRNKYRKADVLIIDDIQFLSGAERTQEEFFHTFNALYDAHKQIVISSDRPPSEISTLEARLRSRFEGGLITDIKVPDFETRVAILKYEISKRQLDVSDDVVRYIADSIKSNIRTLKGALNRVVVYALSNGKPIDLGVAKEVLEGVIITEGKETSITNGTDEIKVPESTSDDLLKVLHDKLNNWKLEGYITTKLEEMLATASDNDLEFIKKKFAEYEENIAKLEVLETRLKALEGEGFDDDIRKIREKILNPDRVEEIEDDIKLVEEKIRGKKELMLHRKMEELRKKGEAAKRELETLRQMARDDEI